MAINIWFSVALINWVAKNEVKNKMKNNKKMWKFMAWEKKKEKFTTVYCKFIKHIKYCETHIFFTLISV
jgi:hypothetical protein